MIQIQGLWWPDDVGTKWQHALRHVYSIEYAIAHCVEHRVAVQAGGNIGLWPRRLAQEFATVLTFEPDEASRECLIRNVPPNVAVFANALGAEEGRCALKHKSLGSHRVIEGGSIPVTTIDACELAAVDLIQLDIEGYEWHALMGAMATIERCHPVIQLELRNFTEKYGKTDTAVRHLLATLGYHLVSAQPGSDFVFRWVE